MILAGLSVNGALAVYVTLQLRACRGKVRNTTHGLTGALATPPTGLLESTPTAGPHQGTPSVSDGHRLAKDRPPCRGRVLCQHLCPTGPKPASKGPGPAGSRR